MTGKSANGFLRALRAILPKSKLAVVHERDWHSLNFSGVQLCISAEICDYDELEICRSLAEHQFELAGQLVADIAPIKSGVGHGYSRFLIDALLLDD